MEFDALYADCLKRNRTIERFEGTDITIAEHLSGLADIVNANKRFAPLKDSSDVSELVKAHVSSLFGDEAANDAAEALKLNVLNTADHHGGLYSAQAFQGDLLFGELLKRMGYKGRYTPLFSLSIVELTNSTYGRGIVSYDSADKRVLLPIQLSKDLNRMVAATKGFDRELIDHAKSLLFKTKEWDFTEDQVRDLKELIERFYEASDIIGRERYADQITLLGERLSREYFADDDSRRLLYIEMEEITSKLLIKELKDKESIVWHIFFDTKLRKALNEAVTEEGQSLAAILLRGVDEKGRRINIRFNEDGSITGYGNAGKTTEYPTDADSLIGLIEKRELLPVMLLDAVILFFERGITLFGGYFQSLYLNDWRDLLVKAFEASGLKKFADHISGYDGSGYISGPVYMLYPTEGGLTPAGPMELIKRHLNGDSFEQRMNLKMRDAHRMGLFEIYLDLIPGKEKQDGWYRIISEYVKEKYISFHI